MIYILATNFTEARSELKKYCDLATDDFETIIITRKEGKNVILISESEYNNLVENQYIQSNKELCSKLDKAVDEIKNGRFKKVELPDE